MTVERQKRKNEAGSKGSIRKYSSSKSLACDPQGSSSFTPVKGFRVAISIELPWPGDETSDDAELEKRVCPLAENKETAGETGVDAVKGDWGGWREGGERSRIVSMPSCRLASRSCESFSIAGRNCVVDRQSGTRSGS